MLFSAKAEYACVAMLELAARHGEPRPVRLADVAEKHNIPQPFLVQILLQLKGAGLVLSTRGASGGYLLAKPPEDITLLDVVSVIEKTDPGPRRNELAPTLFVQNLRSTWTRIAEAQQGILREMLQKTSLADVIQQSQGLQYVI